MRHALFVPPFDELAEPAVLARVAADAEQAGWDGVFVWDHLSYRAPVRAVADPWVSLSAVACATERIRLGPMVTPLPRRRPAVLARQTASLDRLSQGRLVLGVGIAGDGSRELSATGEELDAKVRGAMLDEGLQVLAAAWSGEAVHHRGAHYVVDDLAFAPTPVQRPGPPVWVAVRHGNRAPLRRAARHDGVFPIEIEHPDQLAALVADVRDLRAGATGAYDVVIGRPPGQDVLAYQAAGATWGLVAFGAFDLRLDTVRGVLRDGPPH